LKKTSLLALFIVLAVLGWACGSTPTPAPTVPPPGTFQVDPVFREYYNYLGGEARLGPAISPPLREGYATTQFIQSGKMIFDPASPATSKFRMAPLGLEMKVGDPPVPQPDDPKIHFIEGHTVPQDFYYLYTQLGASTVGKPLTEPRPNLIRQRTEQYFENLGFYRLEGSPGVHLLSYGAWACGDKCPGVNVPGESSLDIRSYIDPAFEAFTHQHGADFTGFALTDAYQTRDGKWEQITENMVLVADSRLAPQTVTLRPLAEALTILAEPPRLPSNAPGMYFYEVKDGLGYEIPLHFWEYILQHGGIELFGAPITHYSILKDQIYHQCFTVLCLLYDSQATQGARVRPEPLGYAYRVLHYSPETAPPISSTPTSMPTFTAVPETNEPQSAAREISLRLWQRYLVIEQEEGQEILLRVTENEQPVSGKEVELTVRMPDGSETLFKMPPTDADGQTRKTLPKIEALNGTIVPFKACYRASIDLKVCVADIFVIWNAP
jgi:hypothetical protein